MIIIVINTQLKWVLLFSPHNLPSLFFLFFSFPSFSILKHTQAHINNGKHSSERILQKTWFINSQQIQFLFLVTGKKDQKGYCHERILHFKCVRFTRFECRWTDSNDTYNDDLIRAHQNNTRAMITEYSEK